MVTPSHPLADALLSPRVSWLMFFCCLLMVGCSGDSKSITLQDQAKSVVFAGGSGSGSLSDKGDGQIAVNLPPGVDRKIIYTGIVEAVIQDFDAGQKKLLETVQQYQGVIAQSEVAGTAGTQRTGRWKVRVPVAQFEAFMQAVSKIGELQKQGTDSKDVTEEFYDLEARLRNKKLEEERLQNHLKNTAAVLADILAVEKELSRVREEMERLQGRRDLLQNLTSLTTVEITLREIRDYKPTTAPSFGTRIGRTFEDSWSALQDFGAGCVLLAVAVAPWVPVLLLLGGLGFVFVRRSLRRSRTTAVEISSTSLREG